MRLKSDFVDWCHKYIQDMIEMQRMARPEPEVARRWGAGDEGSFFCGFFVGNLLGSMVVTFQMVHGRQPSAEEQQELLVLIESSRKSIKKMFIRRL